MFLKLFCNELHLKIFGAVQFKIEPLSLVQIFKKARKEKGSKHIVHIHWSHLLYGSRFILKSLGFMVFNFSILWLLKKSGVKICWTMHNYKSHDYPHPFIDRIGRALLFKVSDGMIVQQKNVTQAWQTKHPKKSIQYIPLGNYVNAYGHSKRKASGVRQDFGFTDNDLIILSFGTVKPYKKVDNVIRVFQHDKAAIDPRVKLAIIGAVNPVYEKYLRQLIGQEPRIILKNMFVPEAGVADLFEMADYSVFWYDGSVLTSAGVALSLSYGLPVIVRNISAADRVIDGENGYLFNDSEQLGDILKRIAELGRLSKEEVRQSISGDSWAALAPTYAAFYASLFKTR